MENEFESLLGKLLDDEINPNELARLTEMCKESSERTHELQFHLEMSQRLFLYEMESKSEQHFVDGLKSRVRANNDSDQFIARFLKYRTPPSRNDSSDSGKKLSSPYLLSAIATLAVAVLFGLMVSFFFNRNQVEPIANGPRPEKPTEVVLLEEEDQSVAMITKIWQTEETASLFVGKQLLPGRLQIGSGLVQIEFFSGARIIAQGPFDLDIRSAKEIVCHHGSLRANVPDMAEGFTVKAPEVDVIDRGTEFALSVKETGQTNVHVVEGLVEIVSKDKKESSSKRELKTGQALSVFNGKQEYIENQENSFPSRKKLHQLIESQKRKRLENWQNLQEDLKNDPNLVVGFDFQNQTMEDRTLKGVSADFGKINGAIIGCRWTEGRWPGKHALEFKRPGDAVRLNVPGSYRSLTYSMWLRVDGIDKSYHSLFLTDKWERNRPHWQIHRNGRFALGVRHAQRGTNQRFSSKRIFNAFQLGNWIHLATVYDRDQMILKHYVNGKLHETIPIKKIANGKLRIDRATIGNWVNPAGPNRKVRSLNGRIGEFHLFKTALPANRIKQIYQTGKP